MRKFACGFFVTTPKERPYIFSMKIFDLHNDALTCGGKITSGDIIYAVWTSELTYASAIKIIEDNRDKKLAIEDLGIFREGLPRYDFMYCGLTWNSYNGLAGGAYSDGRLSDEGLKMIVELNRRKIPVDTAHLNRMSFFDVVNYAEKILCSHTCFNEVKRHPRNLTRDQISVIIEKGGIVGLCFVCDFLGGRTVDALIKHIDWFLNVFGDKNLAIGTDFYGTTDLPKDLDCYEAFEKLIVAMIRMGYSDNTIKRILHGNAAAFFS